MDPRLKQPWISAQKLSDAIQIEPGLIIFAMMAAAWLIYRIFLKNLSEERHYYMRNYFLNLVSHVMFATIFFLTYWALQNVTDTPVLERMTPYVGLITLVSGCIVFIKTARIIAFEYLFYGHMKEGVPVLLVNIFTLMMSMILGGWVLTSVFDVRLAPVLATSAVFSIILGLALQDTLGNLFAGIAMQFDKPYEIGDWIEISDGSQKWVGQVDEISWRATILIGWSEEAITITNRTMAQCQIANFSTRNRPILKAQTFRIPFQEDVLKSKGVILKAVSTIPTVLKYPSPTVYFSEVTDSWAQLRLVYYITDYGAQFSINDEVVTAVFKALQEAKIQLASQRLTLLDERSKAV